MFIINVQNTREKKIQHPKSAAALIKGAAKLRWGGGGRENLGDFVLTAALKYAKYFVFIDQSNCRFFVC